MEEDKAAAYYDELSRKGGGAARFKQGLGFSAAPDDDHPAPSRGSALPTSSSFLSNFVRASSPAQSSKLEKEAQLQSVQNKLKKTSNKEEPLLARDSDRSTRVRESSSSHRRRSRSREKDSRRDGDRHSRRRSRSRSRSRERYRDRDRYRERRNRKRSRSRSRSPRKERRSERRSRSRSFSPHREGKRSEKSRREDVARDGKGKEKNVAVDYSRLIEGYDKMTQAERVKARMKFQLSDTAEKDTKKGSSGWERFEFDQDAPLDDEEVEAAEDDTALVKHIGQSFRFSAVEAKREERIRTAHDEAMFGAPLPVSFDSDSDPPLEEKKKEMNKPELSTSLLSEKVLAKQQGSWRDRAGKLKTEN
ncbi:unnamed protein product [Linum trigynum]|uniref:Uncharacterized protein n=1 Tax=Linum trigynum TaxID=586398 RepID=A0AAV2G6X4_9ROSI